MKSIAELKDIFNLVNKLKMKSPINRAQFCNELIKSDDDEFLDFHFLLLQQKNSYFHADLKLFFTYREHREKVFYFLKSKLTNTSDTELKTDIEGILVALDFKTLTEYENWLEDIKDGKRSDTNEFVWSIMRSPFMEFHEELMKDSSLKEEFRKHLTRRFGEHRRQTKHYHSI